MQSLLSQASGHWVDGILICILVFYALEGIVSGAVYASFDLIKFVLSFVAGLIFYSVIGSGLILLFHIPKGYASSIGFFITAFVIELTLHLILKKFVKKANLFVISKEQIYRKLNTFLGILPGTLSGVVLVMFLVTVVTALPVSPFFKHAINSSTLGSFFVSRSQVLEKTLADVFGGAAEDTLNFLTVEPQSNSTVSLGFTTSQGVVDQAAEQTMLGMVNAERVKRGFSSLSMEPALRDLARSYAREMLEKGYFSHYSPEGLSPFDRMNAAHINYTYAGENLAFSANVDLAMQGFMNSPGHRDNILSPNFKKVGIGVIDAGLYGEMFVQEFTD